MNVKTTKPKTTEVGFVVDHKESGVRYAVSPSNYNPKVHTKVRALKPHETPAAYQPKAAPSQAAAESAADRGGPVSDDSPKTPSAEGTTNK